MNKEFKYGNVTRRNTRIGDKVYYITSPERGNSIDKHTHYDLVEVIAFTEKRVRIQDNNYNSYVNALHLFTRNVIEKKFVRIHISKSTHEVRVIPQSVQVRRDQDGAILVNAFVIESGHYQTLVRFTGAGKLKKAKKWEAAIRAGKTLSETTIEV